MGNDISDKPALHYTYSFASSFSQTSTAGLFLSLYLPSFLLSSLRPLPSLLSFILHISIFKYLCITDSSAISPRLSQSVGSSFIIGPVHVLPVQTNQNSHHFNAAILPVGHFTMVCCVFSFFPTRKMEIRICHDAGMS